MPPPPPFVGYYHYYHYPAYYFAPPPWHRRRPRRPRRRRKPRLTTTTAKTVDGKGPTTATTIIAKGINFTNILRATFLYKGFCAAHSLALEFFGERISAQKLLKKCC